MVSIVNIFKTRNVAYVLIALTFFSVVVAVFLNRYSSLFQGKSIQAANSQNVDIANVNIKTLNKAIFKSGKFQSLQTVESATVDLNRLQKGKKDPFLPN